MWTWIKNLTARLFGLRQEDDYGQRLIKGYGLEQ
jgi:hypothetical protein